jgi:uncharacterized protein (DUF983 family)
MPLPDPNRPSRFPAPKYDQHELDILKRQNNPHNEPTGPFTGRCPCCGSKDLWDDNLAYGCNKCGALLGTN